MPAVYLIEAARCRACASRTAATVREVQMSTFVKTLFVLNLLFAASYLVTRLHAQRPPELDATGAAYMRVNINPTDIPPMVNINPYATVPKVEIKRLPEIHVLASGCQSRPKFEAGSVRLLSGPEISQSLP